MANEKISTYRLTPLCNSASKTITLIFLLLGWKADAQETDSLKQIKAALDSIYISEIEDRPGKQKVLHAEPLYIDLIRDLGARKGEKEWNVGLGLKDKTNYSEYEALVEYEWAPIDRLGLEIELPFSLYYPVNGVERDSVPGSKLNSLKLATQWSFFVSEKNSLSMALGYLHEFELVPFRRYGRDRAYEGNIYNPFFIIAKRWGNNFHLLSYSGPVWTQERNTNHWEYTTNINTNFHYMISGTRNFIGLEFNKFFLPNDFDMTIRPQMRVGVTDHLLLGIVTGIPIKRETERFSTFLRIIYEPEHHPRFPKRHKH